VRSIAKELGCSRNTVRRYLREPGAPRYGPRMPREMFVGSEASVAALAKLIESGRFR